MILRLRRRAIRENRADDANEEVIRHRFEVYQNQSKPVLDIYPDEMKYSVEAHGSPAKVLSDILDALIPIQNEHFEATGNL